MTRVLAATEDGLPKAIVSYASEPMSTEEGKKSEPWKKGDLKSKMMLLMKETPKQLALFGWSTVQCELIPAERLIWPVWSRCWPLLHTSRVGAKHPVWPQQGSPIVGEEEVCPFSEELRASTIANAACSGPRTAIKGAGHDHTLGLQGPGKTWGCAFAWVLSELSGLAAGTP